MIRQCITFFLLLSLMMTANAKESNLLDQVEGSARAWLAFVDHGKYEDGWKSTSSLFRKKISEPDWIKFITADRASRGAMTARYIATAGSANSLSGFPDGEYVVLQFYTTFTIKGLAMETITLVKQSGETWQIAEYSIK